MREVQTVARKLRRHGETFLTKPRWFTKDESKAEDSLFVWGKSSNRTYTLSLLGVVNGLLAPINLLLAAYLDLSTKEISYWRLKKRR